MCIKDNLKLNPFITMQELSSLISSQCQVMRSRRTVNRYTQQQDFTIKTAFRMVNALHNNEKVKDFCERYQSACNQKSLISIDECGFYLGDHRKKGWSQRGKRLAITSDKSLRRVKFTLLMAVSVTGLVAYTILDHNCKKTDFLTFIQTLRAPPGSTILMDNIAFHHSKEIVQAIKDKGMLTLYTIPYSPKLNPIENIFEMIKPLYRQHCPPNFAKAFDYKALFNDIIVQHLQNKCLSRFFIHVRKTVSSTLEGISLDPEGFVFNGYDL